jgi:hypothetical protein
MDLKYFLYFNVGIHSYEFPSSVALAVTQEF